MYTQNAQQFGISAILKLKLQPSFLDVKVEYN